MRWILTGMMLALGLGFAEAQTLKQIQPELKLIPSQPVFQTPTENTAPQPNPLAFNTTLKVCAQLNCGNGLGSWMGDIVIAATETRSEPRQFRWTTDAPGITGARWQVATAPFSGGADDLSNVISRGEVGVSGAFTLTFDALPPLRRLALIPARPVLQAKPSTYWVRVIPLQGVIPANTISNSIRVNFPAMQRIKPNPLAPAQTDIYEVNVLGFEPMRFPTLRWGCVVITAVDPNPVLPGYALYEQFRQSGQPLCPNSWKGVGELGPVEAFWAFASSATDWVSDAYESLKDEAVGLIADGINALPGNLCNATCEAGLKAGLNAGLVALGVPPTLPNMEELTNEGIDYVVDAAVAEAGIPCDADCREEIRNGIKKMASNVTQRNLASLCNADEAHRHGAEPLCLPSWVSAIPAPGSSVRPAQIRLRITRKPGSVTGSNHVLKIGVIGTNTLWIGSNPSKPTNTCFNDAGSFPCDSEPVGIITEALVAPLFFGKHVDLPTLDEGESVDYSFFLKRAEYWFPGHMDAIRRNGGYVRYDDWLDLYRGAEARITADVLCPQPVEPSPASCTNPVGTWQTSIPINP